MTKLIITRGLPGSGKTTWARQQPGWRVNRDDLRGMFKTVWNHGDSEDEDTCTEVQREAITALLLAGRDVVVDDTNLRVDVVDALRDIAHMYGAEFHVQDFTDVPLEVCLERDAARPESEQVGPEVIRGMWERYLAPKAEVVTGE